MQRHNGFVAQLWGAFFGVALLVLLSAVFEHRTLRAGMWRTLLWLEGTSLLAMAGNGLVEGLLQNLGLIPAPPGLLPASASGLANVAAASQILLVYWVVTYVFPYAADDARLRALEAERLRQLAELAQLRSYLQPHFLLNTLNAIAGLVSEDPKEARRLIAALGELLADSLDDRDTETVGEQVEWLRRYTGILEARHQDRLRVSWEIADRARPVIVPRFLLQPLVENAILHGALRRQENGEVHIGAVIAEGETGPPRLVCEVRDNGPGPGSNTLRPGARGLSLVANHLRTIDRDATFRLEKAGSETRAIVELPVPNLHGAGGDS
jgi:hypothetical protein